MSRRDTKGFTLIELLVVVAILAFLASLLLPALTRAKAQGCPISCTNNRKQLMLAFIMYEHDNNDYLPWPNWSVTERFLLQPGLGERPITGQ